MKRAILLVTLLLAACATSYDGAKLKRGEAGLAEVTAAMGTPAMRWQDADGSVELAYPHGPYGFDTFMVKLGPDGRLQEIRNALEYANLGGARAGMTKDEVLRLFGPPEASLTQYFKARDELGWEWRVYTPFGYPARFIVLFDNSTGRARGSMTLDEARDDP